MAPEEGHGGLVVNARASALAGERVMQKDGGDGCTLQTHLILLNCTLKGDSDGKFYVVCILPQLK